MKKRLSNNIVKLLCIIILGFILVIGGKQFGNAGTDKNIISLEELKNIEIQTGKSVISKIPDNDDNLRVYYFDVGQADSILVVNNGITMLIDAGNNDDGDLVVNNLKKLGINKIDYLIGTHPHEDHIGGMDDVIKNFDIGNIYMPKVQANTKTFEDVLDAISDKNLMITTPKVGDTYAIGNATCEIMSIGEKADNLNICSIVIRMTKEDISYLFMGDAEQENELERQWPQTTILKVGHHGSTSSSSEQFLNQIKPIVSIISVGEDNKYGHPHKETIDKLNNIKTNTYMTKDIGNILIVQSCSSVS